MRAIGLSQAALRSERGGSLTFAVRQMSLDFLKPAQMDEKVTVETTCRDIGGASLLLHQRIMRGEDVLVAAVVKIALVGDGRARRFPETLRAALLSSETHR